MVYVPLGKNKRPLQSLEGSFIFYTGVRLVDYEVSEHGEVVSGESANELISSRGRRREAYILSFSRSGQYRVSDHP